jgi:hypothetical protein
MEITLIALAQCVPNERLPDKTCRRCSRLQLNCEYVKVGSEGRNSASEGGGDDHEVEDVPQALVPHEIYIPEISIAEHRGQLPHLNNAPLPFQFSAPLADNVYGSTSSTVHQLDEAINPSLHNAMSSIFPPGHPHSPFTPSATDVLPVQQDVHPPAHPSTGLIYMDINYTPNV